jgi:hypothetical protein
MKSDCNGLVEQCGMNQSVDENFNIAATMDDSDLSPCTSDNEGTPAVPSTSVTTSIPALAPSSHLSTDPLEPKKKSRAPATKKPHRRGGRKSNGF